MKENKLDLFLKKVFTNNMNAPFGSNHHASFTLGNYRYQFLFVPDDASRQKITISSEIKRGFNLKNKDFEYFRFKNFEFFPMDCWITSIAEQVMKMAKDHLT